MVAHLSRCAEAVTIDYLDGTSFLLCRSYRRMLPLGLCQYLEDVTISFLFHVFFLVYVVRCPYFSFTPSYQEIDLYLLAFPDYSSPLLFSL